MGHELAGLPHGQREPQPEHDRVGTGLELAEQLLAGDARAALGPREVTAELTFPDAVDGPELLLLDQAHLVLGEALAAPPVLARRIGPLVGWAVGTAAHWRAHAPAHPMTRSNFLHPTA